MKYPWDIQLQTLSTFLLISTRDLFISITIPSGRSIYSVSSSYDLKFTSSPLKLWLESEFQLLICEIHHRLMCNSFQSAKIKRWGLTLTPRYILALSPVGAAQIYVTSTGAERASRVFDLFSRPPELTRVTWSLGFLCHRIYFFRYLLLLFIRPNSKSYTCSRLSESEKLHKTSMRTRFSVAS